jgi:hypothetical protein
MRQRLGTLGGFVISMSALMLLGPAFARATPRDVEVRSQLGALRFPFVANEGQVDAQVAYYARTVAGTVFVTHRGQLVYALQKRTLAAPRGGPDLSPGTWTVTETLRGATLRPPTAQDRVVTGVSYFRGSDPARWRTRVPSYEQVSLGEVWPGVAVSLRARGDSVEKVFTVSPGAPVHRIRVRVGGASSLTLDRDGALIAQTGLGLVAFTAPVAYQEVDGVQHRVAVAYRLDGREYRFTVGAYDRTRPLIIDPFLQSTFLGGSDHEAIEALAIHAATGDVYVAGVTRSIDFPGTAGGAQPVLVGGGSPGSDFFVARLNASLTALTQATYLGGSGGDEHEIARAIAIHPVTGDVYVAGVTPSTDFPGTAGGAQPMTTAGTGGHGVVVRLNADLTALLQATYLGGSSQDGARALAIHPTTGDVYVAGLTFSTDFPGTGGGAQPVAGGQGDGFVARLNAGLTAVIQATYLGSSVRDDLGALAIAPVTGDVYVASVNDSGPGLVARLPSSLTALSHVTYLGGSPNALAIHPATGDVYVAGLTESSDLPGTIGGARPAAGGGGDAFVARFSDDLTALLQATYLGGSSPDIANGLAVHPATGEVYVAGVTRSSDFPRTGGGAGRFMEPSSAFVARLSGDLTVLPQATYLGRMTTWATALAIHPTLGDVYVAGYTGDPHPGVSGGAQPVSGGFVDGFVSRLTSSLALVDPSTKLCCHDLSGGGRDAILWRNAASGIVAVWLMNGTSLGEIGTPGGAGHDWQIAGVADINGDGMADILWRNVASGAVTVWWLNGTSLVGTMGLGAATMNWTIVGVGDFNGDGRADVLWRDASGVIAIWMLDETGVIGTVWPGGADNNWEIVGVADFNGDGMADILWRHRWGTVITWLMNGTGTIAIGGPGPAPMDWKIVGVGDFNGDGMADLLWRHTSGTVVVWLMNGTGVIHSGALGGSDSDWHIVGVGDFNGDGRADILWRHTSGFVSQWLVDGTTIIGAGSPGAATSDWQIP